ncbi:MULTISPECIES: hypothetical protein [Asticcacaulis]|uniref:hypothetical protein n=1 Tax=Asticcacaulis TaxID=76890 RepID=UPI001AE72634|nr:MULTISPECIES: hypothetical protein [Asticcacaulis]MBP2161771.1 hypothetical protein [Asticcacaulis solisilvae]MDR6802817.1 hypothetical protein [Asticcacaulis sp. BE141]
MLGAAGLSHPSQLKPWHLQVRASTGEVVRGGVTYTHLEAGALVSGAVEPRLRREWHRANPESFAPNF